MTLSIEKNFDAARVVDDASFEKTSTISLSDDRDIDESNPAGSYDSLHLYQTFNAESNPWFLWLLGISFQNANTKII